MDAAKKTRTVSRQAFTRTLNELSAILSIDNLSQVNIAKVQVYSQMLDEKSKDLDAANTVLIQYMLNDEDISPEEIDKEDTSNDEYKRKYLRAKAKVATCLHTPTPVITSRTQSLTQVMKTTNIKLPQIELKKFNGEPKEWLQFWGQFRKIREDVSIDKEDKFQYLLQTMLPNSRAAELVASFPPTSENYDKVITSLKNRFGRDAVLVEVYVRELLKLVMQNALRPQEKLPLASLYDKIESQLRALESLGVTTDKCGAMLFPLVESSLPEDLLRAWQRHQGTTVGGGSVHANRLTQLINFLQSEVENEERIAIAVNGFSLRNDDRRGQKQKHRPESTKEIPSAMCLHVNGKDIKSVSCVFCDCDHNSDKCDQARKMTLEERRTVVRRANRCFCCFKVGHRSKECRCFVKCAWCNRKHFVIMCPEFSGEKSSPISNKQSDDKSIMKENVLLNRTKGPEVILQTLRVVIHNKGKKFVIRAFIDPGSTRSYATKDVLQMLGYEPLSEHKMIHSLFGNVSSEVNSHKKYLIHVCDIEEKYLCNFKVFDEESICAHIPLWENRPWMEEIRSLNLQLSDGPDVTKNAAPIKLLIGSDIAGKLMTGRIEQLKCGLTAIETHLGWTLMGEVPKNGTEGLAEQAISMFQREAVVSDLWNLDLIGIKDPVLEKCQKDHEKQTELNFRETVIVNTEGRYEICLPWKESHPPLCDNLEVAKKRLESTTKRLIATNSYEQYDKVLNEWKEDGIIEEVQHPDPDCKGHFLPHRGVIKEGSTTPLRPVFDASAKGKNLASLNDCLEKGPNLIELISSIVLRFRVRKIGVVADIRKAFLQIAVNEKDRNYLKFFWYNKDKEIIIFRHTRVVFGVSCSPFLLGAVINLHLSRESSESKNESCYKNVKKNLAILAESFYVDNCVASMSTLQEVEEFKHDSQLAMNKAAFDLRGWEYTESKGGERDIPVLGLIWDKEDDTLRLNVPSIENIFSEKITKRVILSYAHKIFDPIGFVCPIMIMPKLLLQETWAQKVKWDDELDEKLQNRFKKWLRHLISLKEIRFDRWVFPSDNENIKLSFHVFCDASKKAYASVIFARIETNSGVKVTFLTAKARVAPLTAITIPRLELLAANMGSRLAVATLECMRIPKENMFFWSDSSTVIFWIQKSYPWSPFVMNQIEEIRGLTSQSSWRHVPGGMNPADLLSRGCYVDTLVNEKWWQGPKWLYKSEKDWPDSSVNYCKEEISNKLKKSAGPLSCLENNEVMCQTVNVNRESFEEMNDYRMKDMKIFVDQDGLFRLNSKLLYREDEFNFRCPVLLLGENPLVRLLMTEKHENHGHVNVSTLLSMLREDYWIIHGRKIARSIVSKCVVCKRQDSKRMTVETAPLPRERVRDARIFEITGVDFAGPVFLRNERKAWICIFTCAVYRAVHFELVISLSTDRFMEALRRFVARRGRLSTIWSDNGTNFSGFANLLKSLDWSNISTACSLQKIEWKFNPPSSPWWGGWWERIVQILKRMLRRVLGRACLDYDEMLTVLCDCESVINSRPLTYLSEDPNDLVPITPNMFLLEIKESGVPDCDSFDMNKFKGRYKYRQVLKNELRMRFRNEYLGTLNYASSRRSVKNKEIKVGDVVLISNDCDKRIEWPLARVVEIFPGKDNIVRVVRLKTASGFLIRPVQRLCPLEVENDVCPEDLRNLYIERKKKSIPVLDDSCDVSVHENDDVIVTHNDESVNDTPECYVTRSGRIVRKPQRY
ncbi:uncharacterized protein LOC122501306 [Leptopilina heterotoma]|uniref:uncharacterized protein LOC122501306 n=1 Tax=Leptopilina heterotoma TaxID=63436 RepID=UPI001CA8769D|nr:uncharacterized protein LOC122501306 [Leptopilina heterotoma]